MTDVGQHYKTALDWLYARQPLGIEPGLERVLALLSSLDEPHRAFRSVHVAGTNGKGSVVTLLARALQLSGHRTGMYTSPHLVSFGERVQVAGEPMARKGAADLLDRLRAITEELDHEGTSATFFEICTAMAFAYFKDREVSWAVVEAGMGGGLDATNVLQPELAIVTNVSRDHTGFLGEDVRTIAKEKAGIAKPGIPLVTAAHGEALGVIEECVRRQGGSTVVVGDDYRFGARHGKLQIWHDGDERTFDVGPVGDHQIENAAIVVAAGDQLARMGVDIDPEAMSQALATTTIPGRLESVHRDGVDAVVDGAHNVVAVEAVIRHLSATEKVFDLVIGFSRDKDWADMLSRLTRLVGRVWAVPIRSPRSLDPTEIGRALPRHIPFETATDFERAWQRVVESGSENVLVTGSLFLAGEAIAFLTDRDLSEVGGTQ